MRITAAQLKAKRKGAPLPRREAEIQAAILAYLRTVPGVVAWRTNTGAVQTGTRFVRFGFKGCSDIIGWASVCNLCVRERRPYFLGQPCLPTAVHVARFLAIEVKRPGEHPSVQQAAFLASVKAAGGIAIVAHSVDDVVAALGLGSRGSAAVAAP